MTTGDAMPPRPARIAFAWRWAEMTLLYVVFPGLLAAAVDKQARWHGPMRSWRLGWLVDAAMSPGRLVFPVLLATTAVIVLCLLLDPSFDKSRLWGWRRARNEMPRILTWWCWAAIGLLGAAALLAFGTGTLPEAAFLRLPREHPGLMVLIWVLYPWLSAYPQEITHRVFFWHRYACLFPDRWSLLVVNALLFAWMHAMFWNWVALVMTFVGGLLFAMTYDRTRSGLAAGVEHGLYGAWCFTTGLGWFVFAGR